MLTALIVLGVAALGGAYLASVHFKGALPAWSLSIVHGLTAVIGVFLLLGPALGGGPPLLVWAAVLFGAAVLGGFVLAGYHSMEKPAPKLLVAGHGGAAAAGLVLLVLALV